jgi:hypothetical protein
VAVQVDVPALVRRIELKAALGVPVRRQVVDVIVDAAGLQTLVTLRWDLLPGNGRKLS